MGIPGNATYSEWDIHNQMLLGYPLEILQTRCISLSRALSGDGTIVARVVSETGQSSNVQAGVMIRETLDTSSTNAFAQTSQIQVHFTDRASSGGSTSSSSGPSPTLPYWVMVVRSGSNFSGYTSSDGVNWVQVGILKQSR